MIKFEPTVVIVVFFVVIFNLNVFCDAFERVGILILHAIAVKGVRLRASVCSRMLL